MTQPKHSSAPSPTPPPLLKTDALAARLTVSPGTIRAWKREGKIKPAVRTARIIRYDLAEVLAQLAK